MTSYGTKSSQVQPAPRMRACPAMAPAWPASRTFPTFTNGRSGSQGIATSHTLGLDRLEELQT